jgi:phosphoglycolate phosphatase
MNRANNLGTSNVKAIIFDMDNTLLQSNIDFAAMKYGIFKYLLQNNVVKSDFPLQEHTSSTMIEYAKKSGITEEMYEAIMKIAETHELRGMEGAGLEPGVRELLESIYQKYVLVVITNNSYRAAIKALELTSIIGYFDLIIGREQMSSLKPSPSGFNYVKDEFKSIYPNEWISVGDSWIDGKASVEAGIPFVSYKTSNEVMISRGVVPAGQINNISEMLDFLC